MYRARGFGNGCSRNGQKVMPYDKTKCRSKQESDIPVDADKAVSGTAERRCEFRGLEVNRSPSKVALYSL